MSHDQNQRPPPRRHGVHRYRRRSRNRDRLRVPAEEAVRMTVLAGVSGGRGGPRGYYSRRTLCTPCAKRQRMRSKITNIIFYGFLAAVGLAIALGALVNKIMGH